MDVAGIHCTGETWRRSRSRNDRAPDAVAGHLDDLKPCRHDILLGAPVRTEPEDPSREHGREVGETTEKAVLRTDVLEQQDATIGSDHPLELS